MVNAMAEMMERVAQDGQVQWIGLRPERRANLLPVAEVMADARGLIGDHAGARTRAVTLIQAEHLAAIGSYLGQGPVRPADLRRNIVVSGLNLDAMKGRRLKMGTAVLRLSRICSPCSRMEETFGPGGYSAVRGHGGWCAEVLDPGRIEVGSVVRPLPEPEPDDASPLDVPV